MSARNWAQSLEAQRALYTLAVAIAKQLPRGHTDTDISENMRLIDTAPALATALRLAYEFLDANYSTADMPDILPTIRDALARLRV
jgi:hypothetical protein